MISDSGRWKRSARPSSSWRASAKCRALKRPVFGSTRASACSAGTVSERCTSRIGAMANGISHGFSSQKYAKATPSAASTSSVERFSKLKSPVSRIEWPYAR